MIFTHFYLRQDKKETLFASPASRDYFGIKPFSKLIKNLSTGKFKFLIDIFRGVAKKIAASMNCCTTPVSLC